jgi:hypothetical protein
LATGFFEVMRHWILLWMNRPYRVVLRTPGGAWSRNVGEEG